MSHTKEPWVNIGSCVYFPDVKGGFDTRNCPDAEANARRIVACVNACEHIPTEWLEQNGAYAIPTPSVRDAIRERDTYRDLCAELKEALGYTVGDIGAEYCEEWIALIAKAESILGEKNAT